MDSLPVTATVLAEFQEQSDKFGPYIIQIVRPPAGRVTLISGSTEARRAMAQVTKTYSGHLSAEPPTEEETRLALTDIVRTKLQNPLEMIHFIWLIEGVTRAFTHQIVRYRVGTSFAQESMRFIGMKNLYRVLAVHEAAKGEELEMYAQAARSSIKSYVQLLERDVPGEFARGLLPTNILTSLFFDCSLRTLQTIYPQRMCCQAAPGEWQSVLRDMRRLIELHMGVEVASLIAAPYERGEPCGYRASFDRPCVWMPEKRQP